MPDSRIFRARRGLRCGTERIFRRSERRAASPAAVHFL